MNKKFTNDEERNNLPWSDVFAMIVAMLQVFLPMLLAFIGFIILASIVLSILFN